MSKVVEIWNGNGFFFKTYQGGDGYYYTVMTSPDFATKEEAQAFTANASKYVMTVQHG
jgi:hypothetical protein